MRPYRRLSAVLALLVIMLLANLSWLQVLDADAIRQRQGNTRLLLEQFNKMRGPILVEATPIASSSRAAGDNVYQRSYTEGPTYATVTGYYSLLYGATGIERAEQGVLSGNDPRLFVDRVQQLFAGRRQSGGAVSLTLDADAQRAAFAALSGHRGAVVALDADTGALRVVLSMPTFDPQDLAPNDPSRVRVAYDRLAADPARPLLNRALERLYPPGTTVSVVTAAAAIASGRFTTNSPLPAPARYTVPGSNLVITTPSGRACSSSGRVTLRRAVAEGCVTALAWLGVQVGSEALRNTAEQLGFGATLGIPLRVSASRLASATPAAGAIGGDGVRVTTLQLALLAASLANRGTTMRPYLVADVRGPDLSLLERTTPTEIGTPMSTSAATAIGRALGSGSTHTLISVADDAQAPTVVIGYQGTRAVAVVVERGTSAAVDRRVAKATATAVLSALLRTS